MVYFARLRTSLNFFIISGAKTEFIFVGKASTRLFTLHQKSQGLGHQSAHLNGQCNERLAIWARKLGNLPIQLQISHNVVCFAVKSTPSLLSWCLTSSHPGVTRTYPTVAHLISVVAHERNGGHGLEEIHPKPSSSNTVWKGLAPEDCSLGQASSPQRSGS